MDQFARMNEKNSFATDDNLSLLWRLVSVKNLFNLDTRLDEETSIEK